MKALIEQLGTGTYRATAIGLPLFAEGNSEEEALRELRVTLATTSARVVDLDEEANPVPLSAFSSDVKDHPITEPFAQHIDAERTRVEAEASATSVRLAGDNPSWQKLEGLFADDPHADDFLAGIQEFRANRDREEGI